MAGWLRTPAFWSIAACVAIAAALAAPMVVYCPGGVASCQLGLTHVGSTGDWRYFAALWEATRVSITDFHQFPSWNPYHCGGIVLYQDPQAPFPGPFFLLTFFWLPTAVGIKGWIFAHLLAGTLGARALIADRGGNHAEQVLGAALMAACGFVAQHTGGGHLSFTPFLFLPLILWSFRRALGARRAKAASPPQPIAGGSEGRVGAPTLPSEEIDLRYIVVTAGLFALAQIEGGTYPVPLMAVAIAIESMARLGSPTDRRGLALALPALAVLFVLLAGVRLVPVLHYLREHPRLVPLDDQLTLGEVFRFWTTRNHPRQVAGHPYVWPEYDSYVGVIPVVLMLAGVAIALLSRDDDSSGRRRDRRIDLVLFAGLIWCALGNIPGPSLFGLLHELPIYSSLRVPSRFLGPAMVGFGLLAVGALTMTRSVLARKGVRPRVLRAVLIGEALLVAGIAGHVVLSNQSVMQQGIDPVLSRARAGVAFHQNSTADYGQFPTFPVRGFGTRSCYVPLEWKPADGLADGPVPQAKLSPPEAGKITSSRWSPNVVELDVQLDADAVLVVNQNYETGWRSNAGTVGAHVSRDNRFWDVRARPSDLPARGAIGLLGVRLPRGAHHVVLQHRPRGLVLGAILTLLGIALAAAVARRATGQRVDAFRRYVHAKLFQQPPKP